VLNIKGSTKAIQIDVEKLKEAITVLDTQIEEKEGKSEEKKQMDLETIDSSNITEEEFLNKAIEKIGEIKKTKNKTLEKESFIKIFKYTGDFAKLRSKDIKK